MENMFGMMTWLDAVLMWLFLFGFCWSVGLFLFALMTTVKACMGNYSLAAAAVYWLSVGVSFLIIVLGNELNGMMCFVWSSPAITFLMYLLERERRRSIDTEPND